VSSSSREFLPFCWVPICFGSSEALEPTAYRSYPRPEGNGFSPRRSVLYREHLVMHHGRNGSLRICGRSASRFAGWWSLSWCRWSFARLRWLWLRLHRQHIRHGIDSLALGRQVDMRVIPTDGCRFMTDEDPGSHSGQPRQLLDGVLQRLRLQMSVAAMDLCRFVARHLHPQLR